MFDSEPIPFSNLFRMAQLDEDPDSGYQRVKDAMRDFLSSDANLVKFVSPFSETIHGVSYGISGVEHLVPDWRALLERLVVLKEPRDAIEKFRESLNDLRTHST
jgi:acetyl/propionyl-CoA carboxylase alpha subunit